MICVSIELKKNLRSESTLREKHTTKLPLTPCWYFITPATPSESSKTSILMERIHHTENCNPEKWNWESTWNAVFRGAAVSGKLGI